MLNFFYKNIKNKKGFTLIELIIVVAILGILAAIAIPRFGNVQQRARINADAASAKVLADATTLALADGAITASESAANVKTALENGTTENGGTPYINSWPTSQVDSHNNFYVNIDSDGVITVTAGTDETNDVELYPTLTSTYGH